MSDFRSFRDSKWSRGGLRTLSVEGWRLKMEPCSQDPYRHLSEKLDPDPH
jgi:hypothetical protein